MRSGRGKGSVRCRPQPGVAAQLIPSDLSKMHFVRTIHDPQGAGMRIHLSEWHIVADSGRPKNLDRTIDHGARHPRGRNFDRRNFGARTFRSDRIHHPRGTLYE